MRFEAAKGAAERAVPRPPSMNPLEHPLMRLPPHTPSATDRTSEVTVALAAEMVLENPAAAKMAETVPGSQSAAAELTVETARNTAAALVEETTLACKIAAVMATAAVTPEGAAAMMVEIAPKVIPRRVVSVRKKATLLRSPLPKLPNASGSSRVFLCRRTCLQ